MRITAREAAIVAALTLQPARAATTSFCPVSNQVCFQWGVPEAAASSGSGSVFFQLRAPTSYEWIGLGIGTQMDGADMFVMYTNGNGNVTLSTRRGLNHIMPVYNPKAGVELLAGSGVNNGEMVANVECSSCSELQLGSSNGWVSAWKSGSSLDSTNLDAQIDYHDAHALFSVDFSKATISQDKNPFVNSGGNGDSGSGSTGSAPASGSSSGGIVVESDPNQNLIYAHGIIMSVVFVLGYPIGSIMMPVLGKWAVHATWQSVVFLTMWAGFGVGYVLSRRINFFFNETHTQVGLILVCLISLQPFLGYLHHLHYIKHKRRGIISYLHIWYGRTLIILGVVNGGLGIRLAGSDRTFIIIYCVLVAVSALAYFVSVLFRIWYSRLVSLACLKRLDRTL